MPYVKREWSRRILRRVREITACPKRLQFISQHKTLIMMHTTCIEAQAHIGVLKHSILHTPKISSHTHFNHAVSLHSYGLTDPWTLAHVPSCTDPCAPSPIFLPSFTSSLAMRLAVWWVPGSPFCLWATSGAGPSNLCRLPVTDFWERGKEPRQVFHKLLTMYVTSTKHELICPFV